MLFFVQSYALAMTVRQATLDDLETIYEFDMIVSYEYFLPLYSKIYQRFKRLESPAPAIKAELAHDKVWFPECVRQGRLWIACNGNGVIGLIIARSNGLKSMEIELLLVRRGYRGQGIGKRLMAQAIAAFPEAVLCGVHVIKFDNEETLNFYQSFGFVNCGFSTVNKVDMYGFAYRDIYYYLEYATR